MSSNPIPTSIRYRKDSRVLDVEFSDGREFALSAEFLRVHSPSAEVRGHGPGQEVLQVGKQRVTILAIEPVGNYAVRLRFDDGHDSGLYAFDELHRLGSNHDVLWADYLARLDAAGRSRLG